MNASILIIIPIVAGGIAQSIKFFIELVRGGFSAKDLWSSFWLYGGMPSSHTAFIISLTTAVGLWEGWNSALFAVCVVVTIIIIRDAIGLRQYLSKHGLVVNCLVRDLPDNRERNYPRLRERLGHTPLEAFVGGFIGILVSVIGFLLFGE